MSQKTRDDAILEAFEQMAHDGKKFVRWTDVKKKTGLSDGKVTRGLESLQRTRALQKYGEIVARYYTSGRKLYALKRYDALLRKKILLLKEKRTPPENHVINIASGLKALITRARYFLKEDIPPKMEYARFAIEHLEYYPEVFAQMPPEKMEEYFPERMEELRSEVKTIDIYLHGKEIKKEISRSLNEKLKGKKISLKPKQVDNIVDTVTSHLLSVLPANARMRLNDIVWTEGKDDEWEVICGSRVICSAKTREEVDRIREPLKNSILDVFKEKKKLLQEYRPKLDELLEMVEEFYSKSETLVLKLFDMKKLKGECEICKLP